MGSAVAAQRREVACGDAGQSGAGVGDRDGVRRGEGDGSGVGLVQNSRSTCATESVSVLSVASILVIAVSERAPSCVAVRVAMSLPPVSVRVALPPTMVKAPSAW